MENENDILSKIPLDMQAGPYLTGYAQAVSDLNKDWDTFRREAAKDILAGWYSNPDSNDRRLEQMAQIAIEQADELIKQLKGGEK